MAKKKLFIAYENRRKNKRGAAEVLAREEAVRSVPRESSEGLGATDIDTAVRESLARLGYGKPLSSSSSGGAEESPTGREWEVVVNDPPRANRGQILNMAPPGDGYPAGNKIILGGFYDDEEAARVAAAITKRFGCFTTFGPKNFGQPLAAEGGGAAKEGAGDCGCGGKTKLEAQPLPGTRVGLSAEDRPDVAFLVSVIRELKRPGHAEMAFVPDVSETLIEKYTWTWDRVKKTFFEASRDGVLDLQPESSHGRLTKREKVMSLPGPEGARLSWVVIRASSGMELREGAAREAPPATVCRPFTRVVRDTHLYEMCLARAKKIGEVADHRQIYELVKEDLASRTQESFFVVKLDFRGQLVDYLEIAMGQQHKVGVDIEDIMHAVINSVFQNDKCDGFAVIHNHPSGKASPSPADKRLTKQIQNAANIACPNTALLDHLVCGMGQYYSFTDEKLYRVTR